MRNTYFIRLISAWRGKFDKLKNATQHVSIIRFQHFIPTSVAQSDACRTADQVAGSTYKH